MWHAHNHQLGMAQLRVHQYMVTWNRVLWQPQQQQQRQQKQQQHHQQQQQQQQQQEQEQKQKQYHQLQLQQQQLQLWCFQDTSWSHSQLIHVMTRRPRRQRTVEELENLQSEVVELQVGPSRSNGDVVSLGCGDKKMDILMIFWDLTGLDLSDLWVEVSDLLGLFPFLVDFFTGFLYSYLWQSTFTQSTSWS